MSDDGFDMDEVRWACLNGQCGPFAALLAARTGWAVGSVQGSLDPNDGIHAVVYHPDGGVVDAAGWHRDADRYAFVYASAQGFNVPDSMGYRVVPLEDSEFGYGPGFEGADFPPAAVIALVFKVLDDIGYEHAVDDGHLVREVPPVVQEMLARYLHRHADPDLLPAG